MATIDSKDIIDMMVKNNGYYMDDPRVHMIVEYTNAYGSKTYGVTWSNEAAERRERYLIPSQFVINPVIYWRAG